MKFIFKKLDYVQNILVLAFIILFILSLALLNKTGIKAKIEKNNKFSGYACASF